MTIKCANATILGATLVNMAHVHHLNKRLLKHGKKRLMTARRLTSVRIEVVTLTSRRLQLREPHCALSYVERCCNPLRYSGLDGSIVLKLVGELVDVYRSAPMIFFDPTWLLGNSRGTVRKSKRMLPPRNPCTRSSVYMTYNVHTKAT